MCKTFYIIQFEIEMTFNGTEEKFEVFPHEVTSMASKQH